MSKGEKTGGRQKGTPNKVGADLRAAAQQYSDAALAKLAHLMEHGESHAIQLAAANALLDRGHGRPAQTVAGDPERPFLPEVRIIQLVGVEPPARHADGRMVIEGQAKLANGTKASLAH